MLFTVLKKSEVVEDNTTCRIDAEYFKIEYLAAIEEIKTCRRFSYIDELTSWVTQGPNPTFSDNGIPCLTGRNINKGTVSYENSDYVDTEEYKKLSRYQLIPGDTLITLKGKGSIGKIGYVTEKKPAIFSRDIGILRPKGIDPCYLNLFILCKYGKLLVDRGETGGTGQSTLTISYLKSIPVPRFGIEENIGRFLSKTEQLNDASSQAYEEAQTLLFSELGLTDWQPKHRLSFVKNYSETEQAGRLDAEHFQPKYDELIEAITTNSFYSKNISEIQTHNARGLQPKYAVDGELDVITSKHILEHDLNYDGFEKTCESNWKKQKKARIQKGDILTYTTGANIGRTACYSISKPALASNHVNILRIRNENPEYVAFVMNSLIGRLQTERLSAGSAQAELYPKDIEKYLIPFTEEKIQQEIVALIEKTRSLKAQSKHLLECAKRAVEIAIEQDEQTAMDWLEEETGAVLRQE
ncbi:MAG: restriction endonuclease subunit S [Candidatus Electrothrix sp. Rat3]|nr:restriction endonuclease subunit S [Candidatus Electrothrix rattekaaiensis]